MSDDDQPRRNDPRYIEGYRRQFERSGNPIYAWEAWQIARANELEAPEWVAEYFDRCAASLDEISRDVGPGPIFRKLAERNGRPVPRGRVDTAASLARAFGFSKGRGRISAFSEWAEHNDRALVGSMVAQRMAETGESLNAAAAEVAAFLDISESKAERDFRDLGPLGQEISSSEREPSDSD